MHPGYLNYWSITIYVLKLKNLPPGYINYGGITIWVLELRNLPLRYLNYWAITIWVPSPPLQSDQERGKMNFDSFSFSENG